MREILFRGKKHNGTWAYGILIHVDTYCCILEDEEKVHPMNYPYLDDELGTFDGKATPVNPETVGEYTGLVDKNNVKIYEGDIVRTKYGRLCIVVWFASPQHNGWDLTPVDTIENILYTKCPDLYDIYKRDNLKVIGNIHDNPELMK